jgi:predicted RNase H-like HicB family nuclease
MEKVEEITVVFLRIDSDDWFAYLAEMPGLHARGKQAKEAFHRLYGALEGYGKQRYPAEIQPRYRYTFHYRVTSIPF